ncbi:hypothetical protein [Thermus brockianus]|uniref:hypothetical protein n=1 Tax=Thermus brockianus TaxID=56956 RepID=UPI001FCBE7FE|nr:hypothetical protein [Thermus brockianus]
MPELEGEQHNLILTQFYDSLIPTYGFIGSSQYAVVGTGSTPPDAAQTGLVAETARTNSVPSGESNGIGYVSPGVYDIRRVLEFTEAQVGNKNLTEWGFSPLSTAGANLMTRELFRDGLGNPIVITPDSDQRLRLIYRYRITLSPTTPQAVSVNVNGIGTRTGVFGLTANRYGYNSSGGGFTYAGITFPFWTGTPYGRVYGGDMFAAECLAKGGDLSSGWTQGRLEAAYDDAAVSTNYGTNSDFLHNGTKGLTYLAASGRSRSANILLSSNEWNGTIKSVVLSAGRDSYNAVPTVYLVFDAGQEITKDNLHKLFIGNWVLTWGP